MPESLKKKTVKGVAWTSLDQVVSLGFGFIIGVILARILSSSDFGHKSTNVKSRSVDYIMN